MRMVSSVLEDTNKTLREVREDGVLSAGRFFVWRCLKETYIYKQQKGIEQRRT